MKTRRSEPCPAGCGAKMFPGDVVCRRCMAAVRVDNADLLWDWANRKLDHVARNAYLRGRIVGEAKLIIEQGMATTRRHTTKGARA